MKTRIDRPSLRMLVGMGGILLALLACSIPARPAATPTPPPVLPTPSLPPLPAPTGTPQPGLLLRGYVLAPDGKGIPGAKIYRAFASYPGVVVATSGASGYYAADFQNIPGDEMVTVWAELPGYTLEALNPGCAQGKCYWRHYYGYERAALYFVARPAP